MQSDRAVEETDCPEQVNFALGQVKMEVSVVRWASEINLSSLVSDDFQSKTISKLKTEQQ